LEPKQLPFQFRDVGFGLGQLDLHFHQRFRQLALRALFLFQLLLHFGQFRFGSLCFL